jgi:hypothetical protein
MIGWALLIVIAVLTLNPARAQIDGMPWMPPPGPGGPTVWPPAVPPAMCATLRGLLNDLHERGQAIGAANERKANTDVACQLFRGYLTAAAKAVRAFEIDGPSCGVPTQAQQQIRENQAIAQKIGQQVCDVAGRRPATVIPTWRWWSPEDGWREFDDPSWRLHPTPAFEGPKPFEMSPRRGL